MNRTEFIDDEEFFSLSRELECIHSIFYTLWDTGVPVASSEVKTSAIKFDKSGDTVEFLVNPDFWNSIDRYTKKFVLCHEMLHILLNHGARLLNSDDQDSANKSADVVINENLVNEFGFERKKINGQKNYYWIDTVFKENKEISKDETFEFYYNRIKSQSQADGSSREGNHDNADKQPDLVDSHDFFNSGSSELIKKIQEKTSPEEMKDIADFLSELSEKNIAGDSAGNLWATYKDKVNIPKKKKWETVIKKWARTQIKMVEKEEDQWLRVNRRFVTLEDNLIIPTEMEIDALDDEEDKIKVWFFQDTSGSCYGYWKRFFKAAKSLSPEKFDIEMHCFDTKVYKTTLESGKLYGFGGTRFDILEKYIQKEINGDIRKYPKAIFVISDGCAGRFTCAIPERWFWFLTNRGSRSAIPAESNIYKLKDFE